MCKAKFIKGRKKKTMNVSEWNYLCCISQSWKGLRPGQSWLYSYDCRQKIKLIKLPTKGDGEQDKMKESRVDEGETVALARCQPVLAAPLG